MATGDNTSLPAVAKQQCQRGDGRGGARFTAESHRLHVAGIQIVACATLSALIRVIFCCCRSCIMMQKSSTD